jgi:hypothetical protein
MVLQLKSLSSVDIRIKCIRNLFDFCENSDLIHLFGMYQFVSFIDASWGPPLGRYDVSLMEFKTAGAAVAVRLVTRLERLCYTLRLPMEKNEKRMISWSTKKEKEILRHTSYKKHLVARDWIFLL